MRMTKQKKLVFEIVNNSYEHLTAYEIYQKCKEQIPSISLGTVYRNLNLLCDLKKIKKLEMKDKTERFDNIKEKHSHFICEKCHKIIDLKDNITLTSDVSNHKVTDYEIKFYGICENCLKEENNG